ncbi:class I SAM-dependent methyltransferase [Terracidiphilus gabretensis]|uniref:class I SAM-dependent methyltransferase n=1 Tax=Terracidiphilus gabretensis TaxID=1577687 RepID=UPI00071BD284|nr:class I SAM-dependent methyltransferase [Terracidiphilus gabretensis]
MLTGKPSRTALRVAIRRAAHQMADHPPVLNDPITAQLLTPETVGPSYDRDMERAMHPVGRDFRCMMAARSRYAEDQLADSVAAGVRQYVVLGAGLDTFAYRNPFSELRVFEVDFPATQEWKRWVLETAGVAVPENLIFAAVDFEHQTLAEGLRAAGADASQPTFFSWLGVVPYLTLPAFRATLATVGGFPAGSAVSFDYAFPPETLSPERRGIFDRLAERVAAAGEPFQLFFTEEQMETEFRQAGFHRVEQVDTDEMNQRYFADRADGLKLSDARFGIWTTAWV